jgi:four helix bundle protein
MSSELKAMSKKKVERFEDLIAWQKARELAKNIYSLSRSSGLSKDFSLKDQLQRSAVSIMSNIAEGFERGSATEFHRFLTIAKASSAELRSQLYVALDVGYMSQETFSQLMKSSEEVSNIVGGLRTSVGKRKIN